jgi:hypothetical protein
VSVSINAKSRRPNDANNAAPAEAAADTVMTTTAAEADAEDGCCAATERARLRVASTAAVFAGVARITAVSVAEVERCWLQSVDATRSCQSSSPPREAAESPRRHRQLPTEHHLAAARLQEPIAHQKMPLGSLRLL